MSLLVGLALLLVAALPLIIAIRRSNELFRLRVRNGAVRLQRGRLPGALFDDIEDIFSKTKVNADIRVVSENLRPRVILSGIDDSLAQRVRNVVGRFALAEIRAGRRVARGGGRRS
jgi:hypothetical protein